MMGDSVIVEVAEGIATVTLNRPEKGNAMNVALGRELRDERKPPRSADTHPRVALVPGGGGSQKLPRLVGYARAKEMLFTCEFFTAQDALQFGLVNRVGPG